jgi:hypothetical protein
MNTSSHVHIIGFCFLSFFCISFLLLPYLYANLHLPRVEELNYSLYPLILWAKQLLNGSVPTWFSDAGLGIPWPIPHTMSHTPLMLLFSILPIYVALAILLMVHIALQSFFTLRLCSYFKLTPLISAVILMSVLLAAPMEYLVASDAAAVYLGWTLLPMMLYTLLKLLSSTDPKHLFGYASLLAFSVGYGILNCHTGVFSTYLLSISLVALFQPKPLILRWRWFLFAALLSLGIGAEKLYILLYEMSYFDSNTKRLQYNFGQSFYSGFWNFFLKPLVPSKLIFSQNYLDILIKKNSVSRTLTFGSPIFALLLSIYAIFFLWYKKKWYKIPNLQKAMWLTLVICFLAQFTPKALLPNFISASWTFRDPAILIGILLAGILCNEWLRPHLNKASFHWLLTIHILLLTMSALFFHYNVNWRTEGLGKSSGFYNSLSSENTKYPLYEMLDRALECHEVKIACKEQTRRVVYDGLAASYAFSGKLVDTGLLLNSLSLHGFQEVSFLLKGISVDSIHPSQSKPYGMISTHSFSDYRYVLNTYDWVRESPALLNLLGIRAVIGEDLDIYLENGLTRIGILNPSPTNSTRRIAVYSNPHAFPRAFFVNEFDLAKVKHNKKSNPGDNSLTSIDVSPLVRSTNPWLYPVHINEVGSQILMTFAPSAQSRTLLLNSMWRPEWRSDGEKIDSFYGLIKLTIPPNSSSVVLEYRPYFFIFARWLTFLCIGIAVLSQIFQWTNQGTRTREIRWHAKRLIMRLMRVNSARPIT